MLLIYFSFQLSGKTVCGSSIFTYWLDRLMVAFSATADKTWVKWMLLALQEAKAAAVSSIVNVRPQH